MMAAFFPMLKSCRKVLRLTGLWPISWSPAAKRTTTRRSVAQAEPLKRQIAAISPTQGEIHASPDFSRVRHRHRSHGGHQHRPSKRGGKFHNRRGHVRSPYARTGVFAPCGTMARPDPFPRACSRSVVFNEYVTLPCASRRGFVGRRASVELPDDAHLRRSSEGCRGAGSTSEIRSRAVPSGTVGGRIAGT